MWTDEQIKLHKEASRDLSQILEDTIIFIKSNESVTEYAVSEFILDEFKRFDLRTDKHSPIVAFRENTAVVHYYPSKISSQKLTENSLILIDLWAGKKLKGSPFADITWMAYLGENIPEKHQKIFGSVARARNLAIKFIGDQVSKRRLPHENEIDAVVSNYFKEIEMFDQVSHYIGHDIGTSSPHGKYGHILGKNKRPIRERQGYTIEPGLYFKNDFGVRTEIDFYVSDNKIIVTTPVQKEIELITN